MTAAGRTAPSSGAVQVLAAVIAGAACSAIMVFFGELLPILLIVSGIVAFSFVILRPDIGLYLLAFISYLNLSDIVIENANAPSIAKFTVGRAFSRRSSFAARCSASGWAAPYPAIRPWVFFGCWPAHQCCTPTIPTKAWWPPGDPKDMLFAVLIP